MERFSMNGIIWNVHFVPQNSLYLIDRTGQRTVATTDTKTKNVYLSESLCGSFLKRVLLHELGHCALYSYGLLDDIHRVVSPANWIYAEELICNLIADYGEIIFDRLYDLYGYHAWKYIPNYLENTKRWKRYGSSIISY